MPEAPQITGLADILRTHGIVSAVVIDDAFDVDIADTVSDESRSTFAAEIRNDPAIAQELIAFGIDAAAILRKDVHALEALADKRAQLKKARPYVETLLYDYLDRRGLLDDLVRHLKTLKLDVVPLGADQQIPDDLQAQIAFIDFYLDEQTPGSIDDRSEDDDPSKNARAKARAIYDKSRAFVILMSSREEVAQEEVAFRKRARLLRGYFQFQAKAALSNDDLLHECLAGLPLTAVFRHTLHDFIDCLDQQSKAIADKFIDEVRDLGLEDYAQLRQLSLNKDGHPFGDYIVRLFGHFLTSLVLEDSALGAHIESLDSTTFESLLPIQAEPSATLGRIYLASLTEKRRRAITYQTPAPELPLEPAPSPVAGEVPAPLPVQPQLLPIELGDLFVRDAASPIYAVMNPACDLALGGNRSREPEDAVLLIPGSLRQLYESYAGSRAPTLFTPIYEMNGVVYRIDWDYRRMWTVAHKSVPEQLLANGYRCERRLQLGPALELQQHFASSIGRVGLPVPPPIRRSHDAVLYCRGADGAWKMVGQPLKSAVVALHMRDKDEFIITKNATKPALAAIQGHIQGLKAADAGVAWNGPANRAQYAKLLEADVLKWSSHFPFHHATGSLPGGRDKEKQWNKKSIEIKERLGVARSESILADGAVNADAVLVVDLSGVFMDQSACAEEVPSEMEEN